MKRGRKPELFRIHPSKIDSFIAEIQQKGDELVSIHRNLTSFDVYVRRNHDSLLDDDGHKKEDVNAFQEKTKRDRSSLLDG